MYCEQCGTKNEEGTNFCTSCGAKMQMDESTEALHRKTLNINKHWIKRIIISAVIIALVVTLGNIGYNFLIFKLNGGTDYQNHPLIYAKNAGLWVKRNEDKKPYSLSNSYMYSNTQFQVEDDQTEYSLARVTKDGKYIFFADNCAGKDFSLYYRETSQSTFKGKNANQKGIRIASGVSFFVELSKNVQSKNTQNPKNHIFRFSESEATLK